MFSNHFFPDSQTPPKTLASSPTHVTIAMTDRNPAAASSKRHCDLSLDDPTPSAKLQRCSEPSEPTPAGKPNGGAATGEESEMMAGARNPRAQRYLVAVEYIGTRFSGSQKQPNQRTVTGVLEVRRLTV